jgi:hypothetical protein
MSLSRITIIGSLCPTHERTKSLLGEMVTCVGAENLLLLTLQVYGTTLGKICRH